MSEGKTYETTAEHFALFVSAAKGFIDLFGLKDWHVNFEHLDLPGDLANCEFQTGCGKASSIALARQWENFEPTDAEIRRTAYHEVLHLLFADAYNVAVFDELSKPQRDWALSRAHHAIIRRFENAYL